MPYSRLSSKDDLKILAVSGIVASSLVAPNIFIAYSLLSKTWKKYKNRDIGIIIRRFHKQELIRLSENKAGQVVIELSNKGKSKLLQYNFNELSLKRIRDGKLRVFLFDIPNNKRRARDILRNKLKELGFIKMQESVFITPYICKNEIEFIINFLEISQYCALIQIGDIEFGTEFEFKQVTNSHSSINL